MKIENAEVYGMWEAIKAARLSYSSWSDSIPCDRRLREDACKIAIGQDDERLIRKLTLKGSSERKFMRQILVAVDITAPRYWWMQFDTYKVGVVSCSESTMHTLMKRPLDVSDFAFKKKDGLVEVQLVKALEEIRKAGDFERLVSLLPQSYIQRRHVTMNYEVIRNIREQREGHKLKEWKDFCEWANSLPHADLFFYN